METVEISVWAYIPMIIIFGILRAVHVILVFYVWLLICCCARGGRRIQEIDTDLTMEIIDNRRELYTIYEIREFI